MPLGEVQVVTVRTRPVRIQKITDHTCALTLEPEVPAPTDDLQLANVPKLVVVLQAAAASRLYGADHVNVSLQPVAAPTRSDGWKGAA